ncbi:hypothetical protein F2P81_021656 [Scophthalmus maximus]|uniref:Uncharacterized protein n=1 Tax=Scophthalmus maximus TaxID=52904 RepID=A0A6A4S327_SCOMX|nr:hypothetical protein F2P81_021656 [Scophthalmus maximus]
MESSSQTYTVNYNGIVTRGFIIVVIVSMCRRIRREGTAVERCSEIMICDVSSPSNFEVIFITNCTRPYVNIHTVKQMTKR